MQLLNEGERGELSRLDENQRDEWLIKCFCSQTGRSAEHQVSESCRLSSARNVLADLRLLAWLATAPLLTTSDRWCHMSCSGNKAKEKNQSAKTELKGNKDAKIRQIRLVPNLRTRPAGIRDAAEPPASGRTTRQLQGEGPHRAQTPMRHGRHAADVN